MTPIVAIALITKLKLIFETDKQGNKETNKFLAFQNGSFPVAKENFYFMQPDKYGIGPIDTAIKMFDFANTFNFVSEVDDFIKPGSDALEDIYYDTLKYAIPANNTRGPEQEERFMKAIAFLNQAIELESGEQTTYLANYDKYEQLYKIAVSEYKNRELAYKNATGDGAEELKAKWINDESALKTDIERNLLNWETLGKRSQVEKYLGDFLALSAASPTKTIADLKLEYELFTKATTIDHLANELNYIPTYFSPVNFFEDETGWHEISLDKSEVQSLVKQAPERLKNLYEINDEHIDINTVRFEYTVVDIIREWLHYNDFLLQPFWKLPAASPPLSDGIGGGNLPAFPQKIIFVRKLSVETQSTVPAEPGGTKRLFDFLFQKLKPAVKTTLLIQTDLLTKKRNEQLFKTKEILLKERTVPDESRLIRGKKITFNPRFMQTTRLAKPTISRFYKAQWSPKVFASAGIKIPEIITPAPPVTITTGSEIELLAFICNKVPGCPAPDPTLSWDD
ncbi:hypothetical protein [Pedobacter antarcticus]|uniref:hypothetical protein n=1 Tax=Pedobacter antarcticus TaxID=34086 RepID=UPI00292FB92D|nr:hypothetical protein [Pedobacter antarcticus]